MLLFDIEESASLLKDTTRAFLRQYEPREDRDLVSAPTTVQMAELGWTDLRAAEVEALHLGIVQHELGLVALAVPLAGMLAAGLTLKRMNPSEPLLAALADGDPIVLLGSTSSARSFVELEGRVSTVETVLAPWASTAVRWLVPVASEGQDVGIWELDPSGGGIDSSNVSVLDDEEVSEVRLDSVQGKLLGRLDGEEWREVESLQRLLAASQLLGLSERALTMTREHVQSREQFGRFLGDLPVVRHKLADAFTDFQTAALAVYEALNLWGSLARHVGPELERSSRIAIYVAGRAAESVLATASQLHGGSGFMARHPLTRFFRRAKALRLRSGGARAHLDGLSDVLLVPEDRPPYVEASGWH